MPTTDLDLLGWAGGLVSAILGMLALRHGMRVYHRPWLGPADLVTVSRGVLVVGVTALALDSLGGAAPAAMLALAAVALALDSVDGWVARRTGTASRFGARADMEVDAFLILVLSGFVASAHGWWVLLIGAARYLLGAAGLLWPFLQRPTRPRYWAKVVAAIQGIVLAVVAADVLPAVAETVALITALGLLAESFGRQVSELWPARQPAPRLVAQPATEPAQS